MWVSCEDAGKMTNGEIRMTILKAIEDSGVLMDAENIHFSGMHAAEVTMKDGVVALYRWAYRRGEYTVMVSNSP